MLQAFEICRKEIPILYLVFIGDGPMSDEVKRKAGRLGLNNRVFFAGYIQPEHLGAVMPAIDIGLQIATKETAAQFGPTATKMATYALYRLLVLATGFSLKGYPEELQQSVCLIPPQNPQALSDRISWMYRHRDEMARIAANLHDFVAHRLTWHCVSRQIIDIMENTAEGQC
jgi:glycosyltransferase involved in cell wall biosynthesis